MKLPFTKQDYLKLLESKIAATPVSNSPIEKLKQAALRLRNGARNQS